MAKKNTEKKDQGDLDDLNDLVEELKATKSLTSVMAPPVVTKKTEPESIDDENIDDFIYRKSSALIQQGVDTIEAVKETVLSGADSSTIEAYSKLMNSVTSSIEILNKINLQKRKEKAAKDLKQMDIETSKKLLEKYDEKPQIGQQTNNIIIASREEIMQAIVGKADDIVEDAKTIELLPGEDG